MNLTHAGEKPDVLQAAIAYTMQGVSVVPVAGKKPTIEWTGLQTKIATVQELERWNRWGLLQGVAIVAGAVSGNLAIIDLDGKAAVLEFHKRFPGLLQTYAVRSRNGMHLYYLTSQPQKTVRIMNWRGLKEIGIRGEGTYTVAPPSRHPSGSHYVVRRPLPVLHSDLRDVVSWVHEMLREKHPPRPRPAAPSMTSSARNPRYVEWVLNKELDRVRSASTGERNDTLNLAAYCLGRLLGNPDSGLSRQSIEWQLLDAANQLVAADGETSVERTIKSGIDAGMLKPLAIPAPRGRGS